jgi:hypothetical protein
MFKFLVIVFLFFAVIYYVLILPFRPRQPINDERTNRKRARGSNVNIDYVPDDNKKTGSKKENGGDYIDYEEVKD